ncbi:carbohydrate binding family 9 domain-containing protein [Candidatus Poribacteria bacterium]|nr:carbohydrate binding family 9 domain-containing protein [Candidatus Poribacteria bacterium]
MDEYLSPSLKFQKITIFLFVIALLHTVLTNLHAEIHNNEIKAYRTYESVEIDGDLTEEDWKHAEPIDKFVQIEPYEGETSSESMEVRILYDNENIYFGFTCFDSDISRLVANEMRRDSRSLHENDNVFLLLDTYNDRRSGFFFRMNALGAIQDRAVTNSGDTFNSDWDAVVECKSKINDTYWTAELSIPFSQLRFKKSDSMAWGLNTGRGLARNKEEMIWVPVSASYGGRAKYRTAKLGSVVGLSGITPSRNLEVLPYILPGVTQINENDTGLETDGKFKIGVDAKYGITSNLTADVTFNTDFAQVEADEEQVNLTRFSLFFPEKRPFFLEGAGLFDFGIPRTSFRRPPPMLLFYSRRIGLAEGNAIPIIFGGKTSGKIGSYGVGFLNVLTDKFHDDTEDDPIDIPHTNFSVMRITKDIAAGSRIGMIAVNKDEIDDYNRAGGFDFEYRPNDNLDVRGLWSRTFEPNASGENNAWYLGSNWRRKHFRIEGSYTNIDEDFNPAVGYVRRSGIRHLRGETRWVPMPQKFGIRQIWTGPEVDYILNHNNELEEWDISYTNWFELSSGDSIFFNVGRSFERLTEIFDFRDGIEIPIGNYHSNAFGFRLSSSDSRAISTTAGGGIEDFYKGTVRRAYLQTTLKPNGHLSLSAQYQFNQIVNLPTAYFTDGAPRSVYVNLFRGRLDYSFTTGLFAKLFAQWNADANVVSTNFLINYIYRPGSDFYFVFNQTYDTNGTTKSRLLDSTVVAKMTYWWNP